MKEQEDNYKELHNDYVSSADISYNSGTKKYELSIRILYPLAFSLSYSLKKEDILKSIKYHHTYFDVRGEEYINGVHLGEELTLKIREVVASEELEKGKEQ